jgi:hypothetical protein
VKEVSLVLLTITAKFKIYYSDANQQKLLIETLAANKKALNFVSDIVFSTKELVHAQTP